MNNKGIKSKPRFSEEMCPNPQDPSILFLGTGAADWPTEIPPEQNEPSDRNWRRLSSALVNGRILIDCGPTVPNAIHTFGVDPLAISDILLTHTHWDHLCPDALRALSEMRSGFPPLRLWCHTGALCRLPKLDGLELHTVGVGELFDLGMFRIGALPANHMVEESDEAALHYLFIGETRQWLYATDGAWFLKPTWNRLRKSCLDAIIWNATIGENYGDYRIFEHNSIPMIRLMLGTMREQKCYQTGGADSINAFSAHSVPPPHDQIEEALIGEGLIPAYDGLCIRFDDRS